MDGTRFDAIARSLSTTGSRREAVKAAAAMGLGLGLARLGFASVDAKKNKKNKKKRCKKLGQGCKPGGKRKCCADLRCGTGESDRLTCCKGPGSECDVPEECCGNQTCIVDPVLGGPKKCRPLLT